MVLGRDVMLKDKPFIIEDAEGHSQTWPTHVTGAKSPDSTSIMVHTAIKFNKLHTEKFFANF